MNIWKLFFTIILVVFFNSNAYAEQKFSFGIGFGYLHGGLGVNVALMGDHDMKYLGAGATGYKDNDDDHDIAFGAALGWVRTDILAKESGKHGLGLVLGVSGGENWDTIYSIGPSYTYFFRVMSQPGFNIGLAAGVGYNEDDDRLGAVASIQLGYQF